MFLCFNTPNLNNELVVKLCCRLIRIHSFESGVLEKGNMQGRRPPGTRLKHWYNFIKTIVNPFKSFYYATAKSGNVGFSSAVT